MALTKKAILEDLTTLKINFLNACIEQGLSSIERVSLYCSMCDTIRKAVYENNRRLLKSFDIPRIQNPVTLRIVGDAYYWAHTNK